MAISVLVMDISMLMVNAQYFKDENIKEKERKIKKSITSSLNFSQ